MSSSLLSHYKTHTKDVKRQRSAYTSGGVGWTSNRVMLNKSVMRDSSQNLRLEPPGITPGIESESLVVIICWSTKKAWNQASQAKLVIIKGWACSMHKKKDWACRLNILSKHIDFDIYWEWIMMRCKMPVLLLLKGFKNSSAGSSTPKLSEPTIIVRNSGAYSEGLVTNYLLDPQNHTYYR